MCVCVCCVLCMHVGLYVDPCSFVACRHACQCSCALQHIKLTNTCTGVNMSIWHSSADTSYVGLARTVYTHGIWPYIRWNPCEKYRVYIVQNVVLASFSHTEKICVHEQHMDSASPMHAFISWKIFQGLCRPCAHFYVTRELSDTDIANQPRLP